MAKNQIPAMKRAARKARLSEREEPGETEDRAEAGQYEAGEEGQETIGSGSRIPRENVAAITPRRPKRPF